MKEIKITLLIVDIIIISIIISLYQTDYKSTNNATQNMADNPGIITSYVDDFYIENNVYYYSDNSYEEQIINRKKDELYKLIGLNIDNYRAYLIVIYDPSTIKLMTSQKFNTIDNSGLERILDMSKRYNAIVGINGGGFVDIHTAIDIPVGYVIKNGIKIWGDDTRIGELIGFNKDNTLTLVKSTADDAIKNGMRDAIEFGPFLIVNGKETINSKWMYDARASRVIIAQREDGIAFFLVTNGGSYGNGPRMKEIVNVLNNYGAYNAANLDGGASTQLVINNKLYTTTHNIKGMEVKNGRKVLNGWGIIKQ